MIFYSLVMLVTGYFGEAVDPSNAWMWGLISGIAYFAIAYEIWFGEASKLAKAAGGSVFPTTTYSVNENGRELFTPSSNGFIMNAGNAQALLEGVTQLVNKGGGGMTNITINETSSPRQTALEVIRANKASLFLAGAL
jgi:hypothetical protein